jgi:hypothetical protein
MGLPAVAGRKARKTGKRAAHTVGDSRAAELAARAGLVVRAAFYLLLAALTIGIAVDGSRSSTQATSHGVLAVVAGNPIGWVAIAAAAAGFFVLGVVRIAGAVRDHDEDGWRRLIVAGQGLFYIGLSFLPASFLLGNHQAGSTGSQRSETASLLNAPGGQVLGVLVGVIVIAICLGQCWYALSLDFTDGMDLAGAAPWVQRVVKAAGVVGILARALVFLPVGIFLIVAAVQANPSHEQSLDTELATVAHQPWGTAVLALVALGLIVFAAYSLLDARYRRVNRAG